MKSLLDEFLEKKQNFSGLEFIQQIKYLAYFYTKITKDSIFTVQNIDSFFELAQLPKPKNIPNLFNNLKSKKIFIPFQNGFVINREEIKLLDLEFNNNLNNKKCFYISGDAPWTDRNSLFPEFIKKLEGEILILDSYYGLGTLSILSQFPKDKKVKFLSGQLGNENSSKFSLELINFKKEFKNIELKVYSKFYELHDRYILSDNFLVLIGHGIKDIGNKECFLIAIPSNEVLEIIKNLRQKFEERWIKSNNIV